MSQQTMAPPAPQVQQPVQQPRPQVQRPRIAPPQQQAAPTFHAPVRVPPQTVYPQAAPQQEAPAIWGPFFGVFLLGAFVGAIGVWQVGKNKYFRAVYNAYDEE